MQIQSSSSTRSAFASVTILFFMWGFITCMNDLLIPKFKADFALTQFFFEAEHWIRLVDELSDLGVDKPVIPGIMPISNKAQVKRMADMSGAALPNWLAERLETTDDPDEVRRIGIDVASQLCSDLIDAGTPGLHLYALNRPESVVAICGNLGLVHPRSDGRPSTA